MAGCTACSSTTNCLTCDVTSHFTLSGSSCVCSVGYHLVGSSCQACNSTLDRCLDCTDGTTCTSCDTTGGSILLPNSTCGCPPSYLLVGSTCVDCMTSCTCSGYGWENGIVGGTCSPVCGDAVVISPEQCDDGNTNDGDGCNNLCQI